MLLPDPPFKRPRPLPSGRHDFDWGDLEYIEQALKVRRHRILEALFFDDEWGPRERLLPDEKSVRDSEAERVLEEIAATLWRFANLVLHRREPGSVTVKRVLSRIASRPTVGSIDEIPRLTRDRLGVFAILQGGGWLMRGVNPDGGWGVPIDLALLSARAKGRLRLMETISRRGPRLRPELDHLAVELADVFRRVSGRHVARIVRLDKGDPAVDTGLFKTFLQAVIPVLVDVLGSYDLPDRYQRISLDELVKRAVH